MDNGEDRRGCGVEDEKPVEWNVLVRKKIRTCTTVMQGGFQKAEVAHVLDHRWAPWYWTFSGLRGASASCLP